MNPHNTDSGLIVRSTKMRNLTDFNAKFLGIPENRSNMMTKLLLKMDRPRFSFNSSDATQRSNTFKDIGKLTYNSVTLEFRDDEDSIMSALIYTQIMKQIHRRDAPVVARNSPDHSKFNLEVSLMNAKGEVTEVYTLKKCFFSDVSFPALDNRQPEEKSIISVTVEYDNVSFQISEKMKQMDSFYDDMNAFDWISI